jgi:hypothetical protein
MEQKTADGMDARAVLGSAFAMGCAPEGAAPIGFDAATGIPENLKHNARLDAVLEVIFGRK